MKKLSDSKTIGIVNLGAPEPFLNPDFLDRGIEFLKKKGFSIKSSPNVLENTGFSAGHPSQQAQNLHLLLQDSEVDIIICSSGGDVSNDILPYLDFELIKNNQKIIMGLSVVTGILNAITEKSKIKTFHGPVILWNFGNPDGVGDYTYSSMEDILNFPLKYSYKKRDGAEEWKVLRCGTSEGVIKGGNLTILQQLIGTPYEPTWDNSILFIEDCFTELHNIYSTLYHFKNAGVFGKISGLIVGVFEECKEESYSTDLTIEDIIMDICKEYDFPILAGVELGHTFEKVTIPIGANALLDLTEIEKIFTIND